MPLRHPPLAAARPRLLAGPGAGALWSLQKGHAMTLTEFLLARIAEDEEVAHDAAGWDKSGTERAARRWLRVGISSLDDDQGRSVIYSDNNQLSGTVADHIARHDPARVLAECEAKRRIVEMQAANDEDRYLPGFHYKAQMIERVLRTLAPPYADHPDYREEWKP